MSVARSHKALRIDRWPDRERTAWEDATKVGDAFTGSGMAAGWAPRSRENAELAYGRLLGFLQREGRLDPVRRVGARLVADDLCALGRELSMQLAPYTVLGIFGSLGMAFSAMDPDADRTVLNKIMARLARTAKSSRNISANLLSPRQLSALGTSMMNEAERQSRTSWRRAILYRDGLLIRFATFCPLRPSAISEMQLGAHLIIEGDTVRLRLPPGEGKKRRLENVPLTDELQRQFVRYIEFYRPMFPAPSPEHAQAVWLSRNGNPLERDGISKRVKERTGRRCGKRFTAHMFRHACATYIVETAPEQALMVVGVLGHAGFRTAQRHYIKGQQHAAMKQYQEAVRITMRGRWPRRDRR